LKVFDNLIASPIEEELSSVNINIKLKINIYDKDIKQVIKIEMEEKKYGMLMSILWVDENNILSGFENGTISCFDIRNISEPYQIFKDYYTDPILNFQLSENKLIVGSTNNIIKIIDFDKNKLLHKFELKNEGIASITIKNDNRIFATGGWDYKIRYFDLKKYKPLGIFDYHLKSINTVQFGNNKLCVCSKDFKISIWEHDFKKKKDNKLNF
jgi:WD40 repeat protein